MAGLDDLFAQIPVQDIASKIGADEGEVNNAIRTLVPALVGGLAQNVQSNDIDSSKLESAVAQQGASGLLDGGVSVDQVDAKEGDQFVARIFGGNDSNAVASALGRWRRRKQRSDQEAAADPRPDRAGLHRQAADQGQRAPAPSPAAQAQSAVAAASATCWAASSAAPVEVAAAGTTRWAASWAACSAADQGGAIGDILGGLLGGKK